MKGQGCAAYQVLHTVKHILTECGDFMSIMGILKDVHVDELTILHKGSRSLIQNSNI